MVQPRSCIGVAIPAFAFLNVNEPKDVVSAIIVVQRGVALCSDAMRYINYLRIPCCGEGSSTPPCGILRCGTTLEYSCPRALRYRRISWATVMCGEGILGRCASQAINSLGVVPLCLPPSLRAPATAGRSAIQRRRLANQQPDWGMLFALLDQRQHHSN
ncbi:hypothetical protein O3P69_015222 [Scylla paramamosain]|uniref:Uncharacterized protein n=1 Tax=Scylla paramamosain TaxID=85552 RepID=A0AAW0T3Z6_SCYPA